MKRSRRALGLIFLFLALILALAAGLRFYDLAGQSLWSDEGNSVALAARSFGQIARDAASDIHPPLYYWLLRIWTQTFGASEIALRSLSAVVGVLLVLIIFELGRLLFNDAVGLGAAVLAAISPFQVYYSQEARMYILIALEATMAVLLFWWFVTREDARLPRAERAGQHMRLLPFSGQLLVIVWAAGLYTHYAFPLIIALCTGFYALWLWVSRGRGRVGWRILRWLLMLALTLGIYAPWLPVAVRQLTAWPGGATGAPLIEQARGVLRTLTLGPAAETTMTAAALLLLLLALLAALPWSIRAAQDRVGSAQVDWLRLLLPLAWLLAPALMILGLGLYREAYLKFLLIGSPAFTVLLSRAALGPAEWLLRGSATRAAPETALGLTSRPDPGLARLGAGIAWPIVVFTLAGVLSFTTLNRYFTDPSVARDDYRGIVQFIIATAQPGDGVLLSAPGQAEVFDYYDRSGLPVYALPRQRPLDLTDTIGQLTGLLQHDKIYAVFWALNEADPQGLIEGWLNSHGYKTLDQWHGHVRLAVFEMPERRPPDETADALAAAFGGDITLQGYRGWNLTPMAGEVTQLQLLWQATQTPARRYKVFLQLLDARDQLVAQRDAEPAGDSRPTITWSVNETIVDNHGLLIPPGTPPGSYRRIIGLYDAETLERLKLPDGSDFVSLPPIQVQRSATPPSLEALNMQYTQEFDFGGIALLGHDRYKRGFAHARTTPVGPGDLLHLSFYWRANVAPRADWWFDLSLTDSTGNVVAAMQAPLAGSAYATTLWQENEVVRGEHDLLIPPDLQPDTYRLSLTLLPDAATEAGIAYLGSVQVRAGE